MSESNLKTVISYRLLPGQQDQLKAPIFTLNASMVTLANLEDAEFFIVADPETGEIRLSLALLVPDEKDPNQTTYKVVEQTTLRGLVVQIPRAVSNA